MMIEKKFTGNSGPEVRTAFREWKKQGGCEVPGSGTKITFYPGGKVLMVVIPVVATSGAEKTNK